MSPLGQAQDGVIVQSEKVYLGANQQPAPVLQVIPLVAPEGTPVTRVVPQQAVSPAVVVQAPVVEIVEEEVPAAPLKLQPIKAKKQTVAKKQAPKTEEVDSRVAVVADPAPAIKFEILQSDQTLSLGLRRWASASGYQLVWDSPKDFPAQRTEYPVDSFEEAVEGVMKDTARSAYPLHACAYRNKVVRVLHVSQSCER